MTSRVAGWLVAVFFLVDAGRAAAQVDTGTILGTVKDQSGAAVPGATVTLANEGTGTSVVTQSRSDGTYIFTPVHIGIYSVSAELVGFQTSRQVHVAVNIQQQVVVELSLQPGQITETVVVSAAPDLLQTHSGSLGQVVGTREINDLPLNGRNFVFLAQLAPGVTFAQADNRGLGANGNFSANGTRPAQNNYLLDGVDNNNLQPDFRSGTSYALLPPVDAIQEFKIQTSAFSAEFGRAGGGVLNATTKSGTNELHATLWEFLRNDKLDAADFFENAGGVSKGTFRRNQFGGTLGGPLAIPGVYNGRNRTFFFSDYQGTRIRQGLPYNVTVPTAAEHNSGFTDFSDLIAGQRCTKGPDLLGRSVPCGTIFDPASTRPVSNGQVDPTTGLVARGTGYVRDPFLRNRLPAGRLDPNAIKLLNLYPAPTGPGILNNFTTNPISADDIDSFDVRVDHNLGGGDAVFGRMSYARERRNTPGPFSGVADGGTTVFGGDLSNSAANVALSETHTFNSNTINEVLLGYSRLHTIIVQPFANDLSDIPGQFGIEGIPQIPQNGGLPTLLIGGARLGSNTFFPIDKVSDVLHVKENLTRIWGPHSFKTGMEYQGLRFTNGAPPDSRGQFTFNGVFTSIPTISDPSTGIAQFLLLPVPAAHAGGIDFVGGPERVVASNFVIPDYGRRYYGIYGQDDWKINDRLSLNLGLRWDHFGVTAENYGAQGNFVPGAPFRGAQYIVSADRARNGRLPLSQAFLNALAKDGIDLVQSSKSAFGESPGTDFAPRVGVAYQVGSRLVARGGYGIFYGGFENVGGDNLGGNYPFLYTFDFPSPDPVHPITYADGSNATLERGLLGVPLSPLLVRPQGLQLKGIQYDFKTPSTQSYNLTLQVKISTTQSVSAGYVGSLARHLITGVGSNQASQFLPPGTNPQLYVPFPDLGRGANYDATEGNSAYHSLQLVYEHPLSRGLSVLADYTWSKCRTDARDRLVGGIGGYRAPDLPGFGIQGDYGLCEADVRRILHFSGFYELPFGRGRRMLADVRTLTNALVGDWQMAWNLTLQDGQPLTVGCNPGTSAGFGCNAFLVPGQDVYGGSHDVNQWLNPAAFQNPPRVTAVGQNCIPCLGGAPTQAVGPGFGRLDWSLFKDFLTSSRTRWQFRAEFFNLTNHPNFAQPGSLSVGATDFARITKTRDNPNDPRQVQLALKVYF